MDTQNYILTGLNSLTGERESISLPMPLAEARTTMERHRPEDTVYSEVMITPYDGKQLYLF